MGLAIKNEVNLMRTGGPPFYLTNYFWLTSSGYSRCLPCNSGISKASKSVIAYLTRLNLPDSLPESYLHHQRIGCPLHFRVARVAQNPTV